MKTVVLLDQYLAYSLLQIFGSSSWLPHSSLEVPLGISLQSESDRREIKVEVQKSHFSVDAEEIVVSPVTPCGLKHCKRARQSLEILDGYAAIPPTPWGNISLSKA